MEPTPKPHVSHAIAWSLIALFAGSLAFGIWMYSNQIDTIYTGSTTISVTHKKTAATKPTTATTGTTITDATADWKTYTNATYGFSFKYPKDWTKKEETTETSAGVLAKDLVFKVTFTNPQSLVDTGTKKPIEDLYVRVYKPSSTGNLSDWLYSTFHQPNTELEKYAVGKIITLGGKTGSYSTIGCCGSSDRNYVVENGSYVYGFGTEFFDISITDATMPQIFLDADSTFQFTK